MNYFIQKSVEETLHYDYINKAYKQELLSDLKPLVTLGEIIFLEWLFITEEDYDSKIQAKSVLKEIDSEYLVLDILTKIIINATKPIPLVSIASMFHIFIDPKLNIKYIGELIALFEPLNAFKLVSTQSGTILVQSTIKPSDELLNRLKIHCYLPPMVVKPMKLVDNLSSGTLSIKNDSLILGDLDNYHDKCISLDILNTLNSNEYVLDEEFINTFDKQWYKDELNQDEIDSLDDTEKESYLTDLKTWELYQEQYHTFKDMLLNKSIYFTHKVDKRGRVYTQGYHFSTMGSSFEKACINLKHSELITGEL